MSVSFLQNNFFTKAYEKFLCASAAGAYGRRSICFCNFGICNFGLLPTNRHTDIHICKYAITLSSQDTQTHRPKDPQTHIPHAMRVFEMLSLCC